MVGYGVIRAHCARAGEAAARTAATVRKNFMVAKLDLALGIRD